MFIWNRFDNLSGVPVNMNKKFIRLFKLIKRYLIKHNRYMDIPGIGCAHDIEFLSGLNRLLY